MERILVLSGHTDPNHSVANKTILEELASKMPSDCRSDFLNTCKKQKEPKCVYKKVDSYLIIFDI